jgi:hypothetical protein
LAVVALVLATGGAVPAATNDLVTNSPFTAPGTVAGPGAGDAVTLELRSVMTLGGAPRFSIFDTATKRATWVGLNEREREFVVKSYDSSAETVNVEYRGRTFTLSLQKAKITAGPVPAMGAPPVPPVPAPTPPPALVNTVKTNPTPAEEAARLQAVVEEIRRRREQRQTGPLPPPPPPVSQPAPARSPSVLPGHQLPAGPRPLPAPGQAPARGN